MKLGYCRVSTKDQNLERQLQKMVDLGIDERYIFTDKDSSRTFDREGYALLKRMVRQGDIVFFDSLDRLGRTYHGVIEEWKFFTRTVGADIVILENQELFDSRNFKKMGDFGSLLEDQFLNLFSFIAEQEYKKIKQRQIEGVEQAKKKGVKFGRPKKPLPDNFNDEVQKWKRNDQTAVETFTKLGISKSRFYALIRDLDEEL